jgi:hypothetical protein
MISSHAYSGRSSSHMNEAYVFRETTLNTKMNTPARKESNASFLKLFKMALKMFVISGYDVKRSNKWIVYHSTPKKLPRMVATTKIKIDKNPSS